MERIVKAFSLSVKFVDIEWPNTSRGISVDVVYQGYTTEERHSEVKRTLVGFLEDLSVSKQPAPTTCFIIKCDVDICKSLYVLSCSQAARPLSS